MRAAVVLGVALLAGAPAAAFAAEAAAPSAGAGEAAFRDLGCAACHAVAPPAPGMTLAQRVARKGPDLWFAGSKLRADWLAGWLENPAPIRGIRYDRLAPEPEVFAHPPAPAARVPDLVAYLATLTDPQVRAGVVPGDRPSPREMLAGRILFGRKQQCFACHLVETRAGTSVGGVTGPSLADAGRRLNSDWVYAYLLDPRRYEPVPRMPIYAGDVFADYGPPQMLDLARFLAQMGPTDDP